MDHEVYTIGYGNRSVEQFVDLLLRYKIEVVCDVRSTPYSRRFPDFGREQLRNSLKHARIKYLFLGDELGARPSDPEMYLNGKASYSAMSRSSKFISAIERVNEGSRNHVVAIMCAEKDPLDCHRAILVAPNLQLAGSSIKHIDSRGNIETQSGLEHRLLKVYGLDQVALFDKAESSATLRDAYCRRGEDLAYDVDAAYRAKPSA